jgi:deazaflavin-dependent oxidoreductase (nitroreductase family)
MRPCSSSLAATGSPSLPPTLRPARPPAWWFNLQDHPNADALVRGRTHPVRARAATEAEITELWPRLVELYSGYEHYRSIATRELPVVILEPR